MEIKDNLLEISNAIFLKKENWKFVTDEQKVKWFFIFNRYFSKRYPELSQLLNLKSVDKVAAMDLWYTFMSKKPYPKWFWSKSESLEKPKITKKDLELLIKKLELKESDINYLVDNHSDFIKEEIKYWNSIENNKN